MSRGQHFPFSAGTIPPGEIGPSVRGSEMPAPATAEPIAAEDENSSKDDYEMPALLRKQRRSAGAS